MKNFWLTGLTRGQLNGLRLAQAIFAATLIISSLVFDSMMTRTSVGSNLSAEQISAFTANGTIVEAGASGPVSVQPAVQYNFATERVGDHFCVPGSNQLLCGSTNGTRFMSRWAMYAMAAQDQDGLKGLVSQMWRCALRPPEYAQPAAPREPRIRNSIGNFLDSRGNLLGPLMESGVRHFLGNRVFLDWRYEPNPPDIAVWVNNYTFYNEIEIGAIEQMSVQCWWSDSASTGTSIVVLSCVNFLTLLLLLLQVLMAVCSRRSSSTQKLSSAHRMQRRVLLLLLMIFIVGVCTQLWQTVHSWIGSSVLHCVRVLAKWGVVAGILNMPNLSKPVGFLDPLRLGTIVAPVTMAITNLYVWFYYGKAMYDDMFAFTTYGKDFEDLNTSGWVFTVQGVCAASIAYAVGS